MTLAVLDLTVCFVCLVVGTMTLGDGLAHYGRVKRNPFHISMFFYGLSIGFFVGALTTTWVAG